MLAELHIQNFALIENLRFEVGTGLNVLTGETGAGKSIIVDALGAALGERTGSEVVRTGADKCLVEAVFDLSDDPAAAKAAETQGFEPEDGILILSREISRSGKSQYRINGRLTTAGILRDITSYLIDIHGQHEHQSLLSVPLHIDIFDSWCDAEIIELKTQARKLYDELTVLTQERDRLQTDERERARLLDLYKFQIDELQAAELRPGEEEELAQERNRLANAEKLYTSASEIYNALGGDERGAVDNLSTASIMAEKMALIDSSMESFVESLNAALISAQEALASIRDYRDEIEANPARLEQVEARLDAIRLLKRKYGDTIEDILQYADGLAKKVDDLTFAEDRSQELTEQINDVQSRLTEVCDKLTSLRRTYAPEFEKAVEKELADLAMGNTRFEVSIEPTQPGPKGADAVEFLISPNPGEPVKPLVKIASGGEMSRIMLALKTVTARPEVPTLVFDEIDTGIGGRTAQVLGDKLASLAARCQVMCVTHLPQIASKARQHYTVDKTVESGRSFVRLNILKDEDRVMELARMLGGKESSSAAIQHAREMLSVADSGNA